MQKALAVFAIALAFAAFAPPAEAQQKEKFRRIGFLSIYSKTNSASVLWNKAFQQGLRDHGWVQGKNIAIVYRWAEGDLDRLPDLAAELLRFNVEIIVTHGGSAVRAVQLKSKTVPIVMAEVSDAVGSGIVKSLARPGGNVTGLTSMTPQLGAKRLELLKEIVPNLTRVSVLWTSRSPASKQAWVEIQGPARQLGLSLVSTELRNAGELGKLIDDVAKTGVGAVFSTPGVGDSFNPKEITDLVAKNRLPTVYENERYVEIGGLMSYARDVASFYRRAATYVDKILKGIRPANLPVEQPTRFRLVVNLKTAKALGLTVPS